METQEVELAASPTALLLRCLDQPSAFVLDGGGAASWGSGRAWLGCRPCATLRVAADGTARLCRGGTVEQAAGDPFDLLEGFCAAWGLRGGSEPRAAGVLVALGYDLRRWIERLPPGPPDEFDLPVLYAAAYDWLLSYSYDDGCSQLASPTRSPAELRALAADLGARAATVARLPVLATTPIVSNFTRHDYLRAVDACLGYIAAGDVYQVNLAQRFAARLHAGVRIRPGAAAAALFATLQRRHAMPYAAYVDAGDFALASNSPECFLRVRQGEVATYPIKGTRPRGADPQADAAMAQALYTDPKERAEHLMIVDLERNDLGRVCRTGSVHVPAFAQVRRFPSLHHLESTVAGSLRAGVTLGEVLRATFPGGSITGAPKIRAMEIIDTLEPAARGFYTGAIGLVTGDEAVFNIAIRTAVASHGRFAYYAGGGIVADSIPAREYDETLLKTQPFLTALTAQAA